jgi:5-methylcytosine-specific restriction endonuclease McrA
VHELIAAATGRRKTELESWIAERFPGADAAAGAGSIRPRMVAIQPVAAAAPAPANELALAQVGGALQSPEHALAHVPAAAATELAPAQVPAPAPAARYVLQVPISEATRAKVHRAQDLLAHTVPSGDLAAVLDRALDALLVRLEKRKGAASATRRRQARTQAAPHGRTIPADVRRAVWERDGGRCTFTSPAGRRCDAKRRLEFDHVVAFARGGRATLEGLRLRCRAHNQLEAERTFGTEFMRRKRAEVRHRSVQVRDAGVEAAPSQPGGRGTGRVGARLGPGGIDP